MIPGSNVDCCDACQHPYYQHGTEFSCLHAWCSCDRYEPGHVVSEAEAKRRTAA